MEFFILMGIQFTKEFTITSCGPEDPGTALVDCLERVDWSELKFYVGIMQRFYLKVGMGTRRAIQAVSSKAAAIKLLQDL